MPNLLNEVADHLANIAANIRRHATIATAVLEASPDGMVVTDRNGEIIMVNQALEVMSGYWRQDLIGKPIETLVPIDLRDQHRTHRANYYIHPVPRDMSPGRELKMKTARDGPLAVRIGLYPAVTNGDRFVVAVIRRQH